MTQENKELLIKDLSCRIPYGVIVNINGTYNNVLESVNWYYEVEVGIVSTEVYTISDVKPYLFPLSSMSKEQEQEEYEICKYYIPGYESNLIDFYNKNHFDYRGLIEKGLAIDATGLNIY